MLLGLAVVVTSGCGFDLDRATHFSYVSDSLHADSPAIAKVGGLISERACTWAVYAVAGVFGGGDVASESELVRRALERTHSQVLVDADFTRSAWSVLVYTRSCRKVTGQPANLVSEVP